MTATDQISYTRPFSENIRGQLYARFRLDPDGIPEFEPDQEGFRHYTIDLYLYSPRSEEIDEVKYILEDEAYIDPIASSRDKANDFHEEIQGSGEVPVIVQVQIGGRVYEQRAWLSQMLENGHAKDITPRIRSAINRIKVF